MPTTLMASVTSTVITFLIPDTCTVAQWPVIVTVSCWPLMSMALLLQAIVRTSSIPEMVMLGPAGVVGAAVGAAVGADADGADGTALGAGVTPAVGAATLGKTGGLGGTAVMPMCEIWCLIKKWIPIGTATMPIMKSAARIQNARLTEPERGDDHELP
jgi:hypothetical protein